MTERVDPKNIKLEKTEEPDAIETKRQKPDEEFSLGSKASETKVKNLSEFKEKAPEIWEKTIKSLCQSMIDQNKKANDRMIKKMKEMHQTG